MARSLIEITATVARERHRFGEAEPFTVILDGTATLNGDERPSRIVLKGKTEGSHEAGDEEPRQHFAYRFYGEFRHYENRYTGDTERQFHYQTFVRAEPHTKAGIVAYLDGAPNIGRVLAMRLWDKFGSNAVKILREQPEVAAAACERLSVDAAMEAAAWLDREKALEDCSIELVDLLEGRGFPKVVAKQAVKEFGNRAAAIIKANPYLMMRFRGCGFKRADALYLDLGHPPARLKRQALCAWHHVARNGDGDTWQYRKSVDVGLAGAIGGADVKADAAVELAGRVGMLAVMRTDGPDGPPAWDGDCCWVAEGAKARNEARLAGFVVEAMEEV